MAATHDFEAIWRDAGSMIWRSIYAYAGGRRDIADDAVAEAFARAIARRDTIRDPVPYIYRVAFRIAAEELRRSRHQEPLREEAADDPEDVTDILDALKHLTPAQRATVYLHYQVDLPVRQVAAITGLSSASVRVHLMRGRRRLAEMFSEQEVEA